MDVAGRTLYLVGEVSEDSIRRVIAGLDVMDRTEGTDRIVMVSTGGCVDSAWALYDAILTHDNPVQIDGLGVVQSAAALILQAADLRRLSPNCRFMVHPGNAGAEGATPTSLHDIANEIMFLHGRYAEVLAVRSGHSLNVVKKLCSKESFLSAEEAVRNGFADEVMVDKKEWERRCR